MYTKILVVHDPTGFADDAAAIPAALARRSAADVLVVAVLGRIFDYASAGALWTTRRLVAEHGAAVTVVHCLEDVSIGDDLAYREDDVTASPVLREVAGRFEREARAPEPGRGVSQHG